MQIIKKMKKNTAEWKKNTLINKEVNTKKLLYKRNLLFLVLISYI